jgi:hypothetical protein
MSATMSSAYTYVSDTYRRVVVGDWKYVIVKVHEGATATTSNSDLEYQKWG